MWSNWKEPEVVATRITGTVKWFNVKAGYGFITRDDTNEDVFVHRTAIMNNNPGKAVASVGDGEFVEFDVVIKEKRRPEAANVSGLDGAPVQGSPFAANKPHWDGASYEYIKYASAALEIPTTRSPSPCDSRCSSSDSHQRTLSATSSSTSSHFSCSPEEPCPGPVAHVFDDFACPDPACFAKDGSEPSTDSSDCSQSSSSSCSSPTPPLDDFVWRECIVPMQP